MYQNRRIGIGGGSVKNEKKIKGTSPSCAAGLPSLLARGAGPAARLTVWSASGPWRGATSAAPVLVRAFAAEHPPATMTHDFPRSTKKDSYNRERQKNWSWVVGGAPAAAPRQPCGTREGGRGETGGKGKSVEGSKERKEGLTWAARAGDAVDSTCLSERHPGCADGMAARHPLCTTHVKPRLTERAASAPCRHAWLLPRASRRDRSHG